MLKKFLSLLGGLSVLCALAYCLFWFIAAGKLNTSLKEFYARNAGGDLELRGEAPIIKGFPLAPQATFTQGLTYKGVRFDFEEMHVSGYTIFGLPVTIDIPEGVRIATPINDNLLTFSELRTTISAPNGIPALYEEDLSAWQRKASGIDILNFEAVIGPVDMYGSGTMALDQELQPIISLNTTMTGYAELIDQFQAAGNMPPVMALTAKTALNNLAKEDEETGEKILTLPIFLQYQRLNIGPLRLATFPEIRWERRTPLAPPQ